MDTLFWLKDSQFDIRNFIRKINFALYAIPIGRKTFRLLRGRNCFPVLNNLFLFSIKTYFLGGQRTSVLFKITLSTSVSVRPLFILTGTSFDAFDWLLQKTIFSTVVQSSKGVLCNVQGRPEIVSSSKLKINKANAVSGHLILKWYMYKKN